MKVGAARNFTRRREVAFAAHPRRGIPPRCREPIPIPILVGFPGRAPRSPPLALLKAMERKPGPLECKQKLEETLARATRTLQELLAAQLQRLQGEYEAIRATHFPCVVQGGGEQRRRRYARRKKQRFVFA